MKYHIVFKEKEEDIFSTGKTYEAIKPEHALCVWEAEYPEAIFCAMYIDSIAMNRDHIETPVGDIKLT